MMKYIRTDQSEVVIFSNSITHSHMTSSIKGKVISAGYLWGDDQMGLRTYGESYSLGIGTKPDDLPLIKAQLHR